MPLHDWRDSDRSPGVHHTWITELQRALRASLPSGYAAVIGYSTRLTIGGSEQTADVSVRETSPGELPTPAGDHEVEPDVEVAVAVLEEVPVIHVQQAGRLVAAVEVISPRNKDRPAARDASARRLLGYLLQGIHLLVIDVHPRPYGFSYADAISANLDLDQPPLPAPMAIAYRVGEPVVSGGRLLALWRRPLSVGEPLPLIPLPLTVSESVTVDLETTYRRAAEDFDL